MAESSKAPVLQALSEWGDIDDFEARAREYLAPDAEYVEDPDWPGAGAYRGIDAIVARWREYADLLGDDVTAEVQELVETERGIFVRFRNTGRATASGMSYDHTWGYVFRVCDGRISYWRAYFEPDDARRAVGL